MNPELLGRYYISGIGETEIGHQPEETPLSLALKAAQLALADGSHAVRDIDGLIVEYPYSDPHFLLPSAVAESLGIRPRYAQSMDLGGASAVAALSRAACAIESGQCRRVLYVNADSQLSAHRGRPTVGELNWGYQEFEEPFGLVGAVGGYALGAQAHRQKYGTPAEAFGYIAMAMRNHASLNDNAQQRKPFSMEEYLDSRFIVEPLRLLDCCLISDYGGAFVVSADSPDPSRRPAVVVAGYAEQHDHRYLNNAIGLTESVGPEVADRLWRQTGLEPAAMDLGLLYDSFTYTVLLQLEDYGFCPKGEALPFLERGSISLGGSFPVNPHGGLLSQGHSNGVFHVCEAVRQLRGEAGARTVPGAERALVTGAGGILMGTHAAAILQRREQ